MTREERAREVLNQHCEYMDGLNRGQVYIGVKAAHAAMLQFADAEAAAMGERAAVCVNAGINLASDGHDLTGFAGQNMALRAAAQRIRALPATGEVGRD